VFLLKLALVALFLGPIILVAFCRYAATPTFIVRLWHKGD
jgi:hypothetical protein